MNGFIAQAVQLRGLFHIAEEYAAGLVTAGITTLKVIVLHHGYGGVPAIVQDKQFDGQTVSPDQRQLLEVVLHASIALNGDGPAFAGGNAAPDGGRQCKTHAAKALQIHHRLSRLSLITHSGDHRGPAG